MSDKRYTIGQVAKICNISTEQLRHYDKKEIFSPQLRDDDNNYRYYTEDQINDILLLKELKQVGLPLKTIAILIQNKELRLIKSHLQNYMTELRNELQSAQRQYNQLIDILLQLTEAISLINDRSALPLDQDLQGGYQLVDVPRRQVVYTRYPSDIRIDTYLSFIHRYAELLNIVDQSKISVTGPISVLFHDHYSCQFSPDKKVTRSGDLEISMDVEQEGKSAEHIRLFGGFKAAMAVHIGPYATSLPTYQGLEQWAKGQGYKATGASIMELVVGRTRTDISENFVTKLYLPVDVSAL